MPKAPSETSTTGLSKSSTAMLKRNQVTFVGTNTFLHSEGYRRLVINVEDGSW